MCGNGLQQPAGGTSSQCLQVDAVCMCVSLREWKGGRDTGRETETERACGNGLQQPGWPHLLCHRLMLCVCVSV